jgi:hypothetical protein
MLDTNELRRKAHDPSIDLSYLVTQCASEIDRLRAENKAQADTLKVLDMIWSMGT